MYLLGLIGAATVCYALYDVFAAKAGGKIDANLGAVIINGLGTVLPLLAVGLFWLARKNEVVVNREGLGFSLLAGVAIALFSVLIMKIFASGSQLSYVIPVVYGGAIVLTAVIGLVWWKEAVNNLQLLGLAITLVGIAIVVISRI